MTFDLIVPVIFKQNGIFLQNLHFNYNWNDDLAHVRESRSTDGYARIDPEDLTAIFVLWGGREIQADVMQPSRAENCILVVQDDFWGTRKVRLHRAGRRSRNFNDKQIWSKVPIPGLEFVSLAKHRCIKRSLDKYL